jgi:hypothetical protein
MENTLTDEIENNPLPDGEELSTPADDAEVEQETVEADEAETGEVESPDGEETEQQAEQEEEYEYEAEDGKKYSVPKALKDSLLRQSDYTRKTQEVAEQRKAFEAQQEQFRQMVQLQTQSGEKLAEMRMIDQQLEAYKAVDWDALQEQDPHEYMRHDRIHRGLMQKRQDVQTEHQRATGELQQRQRAEHAKAVQENSRRIAEMIPDWSPERAREVRDYGLKAGISESELNTVYKASHIALLHKAMQFDKLAEKRTQKPKPAPAQPVTRIKPKTQSGPKDPSKMSMDDYAKWRANGGG